MVCATKKNSEYAKKDELHLTFSFDSSNQSTIASQIFLFYFLDDELSNCYTFLLQPINFTNKYNNCKTAETKSRCNKLKVSHCNWNQKLLHLNKVRIKKNYRKQKSTFLFTEFFHRFTKTEIRKLLCYAYGR